MQFTVKEEQRDNNVFTFKKLESENFDLFSMKNLLKWIYRLLKQMVIKVDGY